MLGIGDVETQGTRQHDNNKSHAKIDLKKLWQSEEQNQRGQKPSKIHAMGHHSVSIKSCVVHDWWLTSAVAPRESVSYRNLVENGKEGPNKGISSYFLIFYENAHTLLKIEKWEKIFSKTSQRLLFTKNMLKKSHFNPVLFFWEIFKKFPMLISPAKKLHLNATIVAVSWEEEETLSYGAS